MVYDAFTQLEDNQGNTPLALAVFTGQMAFVKRFFPCPPKEGIEVSKSHTQQIATNLLKALADEKETQAILACCPGETTYDKLAHTFSAVLAMIGNGHADQFKAAFDDLDTDQQQRLPLELRYYIEHSDVVVSQLDAVKEEYHQLDSATACNEKLASWEPSKKETKAYLAPIRGTPAHPTLFCLIDSWIQETDTEKKNERYNQLIDIISPLAPYDQKVDFCDTTQLQSKDNENIPILHYIMEKAVEAEGAEQDDIKEILTLLLIKHPDIAAMTDKDGQTITDITQGSDYADHIKGAIEDLPARLIEKRVHKAYRYPINDLGVTYSQKENPPPHT